MTINILKVLPGKPDIKRHSPGTLYVLELLDLLFMPFSAVNVIVSYRKYFLLFIFLNLNSFFQT